MLDLGSGQGIDALVHVSSADMAALSPLFGTELPELGAIEVSGRLVQAADSLALENLVASVQGPHVGARVSGGINQLETWDGFDLTVTGETSSLGALLGLLGVELDRSIPESARAQGTLRGKASALRLDGFTATVGEGDLVVEAKGSVPNVHDLAAVEASVTVSAKTLAVASELAGRELPNLGPVNVSAEVVTRDGRPSLESIDARLTAPFLEARVTGSVADLVALEGIDLAVDLKSSEVVKAVAELGYDLEREIPGTLTASGRVSGALDNLTADGIQARLVDDGLEVDLSGSVEELHAGEGVVTRVELSADSLSRLEAITGSRLPEVGPFHATARLANVEGVWSMEELDAKLEHPQLNAEIKGSVANLARLRPLDLDLVVHAPSLKEVFVLLDPESTANPGGGLDAEARLRWEGDGFRLDPLEASFGTSTLTGDVTWHPGTDGSPPKLRAQIRSANLDIADLRQIVRGGATSVRRRRGDQPAAERTGKIFSTEDLPFHKLHQMDAQISLQVDRANLFGFGIHDGKGRLSVSGGLLSAMLSGVGPENRPGNGSLEIDATSEPPRLELHLDGARIAPNLLVPEEWIIGGTLLMDATLEARGSSVSALMAGLNGSATVEIRGAETKLEQLNQFGSSLIQQIDPSHTEDGVITLRCVATELEVVDGMLRFRKGPIVVTERVAWFVHGWVDLGEEMLEVHARPEARKGFGIGGGGVLAGLLQISGPISSPDIKADPLGVPSEVTGVLKSLFSRGKSLLKGKWHDLEVCQKIGEAIDQR
jgi:hypothetical protein